MAATITPTLRAALERLKHGGTVNGILLGWRRQILVNLLPYEDFRAERVLQVLLDAHGHYATGERDVRRFWFAFEGVFALALFRGECTLLILHTHAAEVDFLAKAAGTFLEDTQLLVDALLNPSENDDATQPLVSHDDVNLTKLIPR